VLIHGAGDEVLQRCHYPALVAKWNGETDAILSVSAPSNDYPGGAAIDMESYAFFNAALRFSDSELVQALKVISDNRSSGIEHLNAAKLTDLMLAKNSEVMAFIKSLSGLIRPNFLLNYDVSSLFELRGTHSQRLQITQLLQKLEAMKAIESASEGLTECQNLSEALKYLQYELSKVTPSLGKQERV